MEFIDFKLYTLNQISGNGNGFVYMGKKAQVHHKLEHFFFIDLEINH